MAKRNLTDEQKSIIKLLKKLDLKSNSTMNVNLQIKLFQSSNVMKWLKIWKA